MTGTQALNQCRTATPRGWLSPLGERTPRLAEAWLLPARGLSNEACGCASRARLLAALPARTSIFLSADRLLGMNGLAMQVQEALQRDPHAGDLCVFRGAKGNLIKILWQ